MVVVDLETDCWIWQGGKCKGYGRLWNGKFSGQAHRVLWVRCNGRVPRGMDLGHTCTRRSCCNPAHVRPITKQKNDAERFVMPALGEETLAEIYEAFDDDKPNLWIAYEFGISVWAVRRLASAHAWRNQLTLDLGVPF
jgi:hypothetical protein